MEEIIEYLKKCYSSIQDQVFHDVGKIIGSETKKMTIDEINRRVKDKLETGKETNYTVADSVYAELRQDPEKFIDLTDKKKDEISKMAHQQVVTENATRTYMVYLLDCLIEQLELKEGKIFLEFDKYSELVQYINLPYNMQIEIFFHMLRINKKIGKEIELPLYIPNLNAIGDHEYKHIDSKKVRELIKEDKLAEFMDSKSLKYIRARKEIDDIYEATKIDASERFTFCINLADIFAKDAVDMDEKDYEAIIDNMDKLGISHLSYRIVKQFKKAKEDALKPHKVIIKVENKVEKPKPKYSKKEINQVHYEISKLYDLEHFKSKTVLSLDEIIYLLSLMYKIEMKESIILKFLESVSREYRKNNPICIFYQSYDKFKSYDNEEINEHLEMLEYILNDTNIFICSNDEYEETKELVSIEINAIMDILSGNYTYEINKAKSLLKVSEE